MLTITPLFSGSSGNATLIQSHNTKILLDIGYKYQQIVQALAEVNVTPSQIDAIVITHEHSDHVSALPMWSKFYDTPLYVPHNICEIVANKSYCTSVSSIVGNFAVGDIAVQVFNCNHDAVSCCGYKFICENTSIACVTDTGSFGVELIDFLQGCQTVYLESNHDVDMLKRGFYPYLLKRRILSDYGHLSNSQTAQILKQLDYSATKNIVLAHLSENNNTPELAFASAVSALKQIGIVEGKDVKLFVAKQHEKGETI